jgi:hypothetical protein
MTVLIKAVEEEVAAKVGLNMGALQKLKGTNSRDVGINEDTKIKLKYCCPTNAFTIYLT